MKKENHFMKILVSGIVINVNDL